MDKAIAICLTALLLLAGCLSSDDDDIVSIVGCDDESALNYDENATESGLCALEDDLEAGIVSFVNLMDEGPDMDNITSTIGYSMEVSSVMGDDTWHYMETMVVTPDGMKVTIEDNYGEETLISNMIVSGSEVQYSFNNGTTDYQVRMSHEGTTLEAFGAMMNMGLDMDMGDDMDSGEMFVCDNGEEIPADWVNDGMYDCEDRSDEDNEIEMFVCDDGDEVPAAYVNDGDEDCDDGSDEDVTAGRQADMDMGMGEDENPESGDYTGYFNPVTATFSGFEVTDEGMVFSGLLNVEGALFGALEVHTTSDLTVTGFSMMDVNDENNWVKFVLINSGETVVDNTLPLSALPFILIDPTLLEDDEGEDMDEDMVCYDMDTHEVVDIYDEMDCYDAGYLWTSMDRDDHDGHDEDREEDMVCYDIDTHEILEDYDNQMDCEYAGYMWVSSDSGDEHTGENSWSFDRGMEDCDSDDDTMVSYEELVVCINNDLSNDGFGDMSASDVGAEQMFNMSDMDNDLFLNESELDYLNSMYSSDEDEDHEDREDMEEWSAHYVCISIVEESMLNSTQDFSSVFNNSNLDDSLCGTPADDVNYTFDNSTFNLPVMMVYEQCSSDENNTTMCDYGTFEAVEGEVWVDDEVGYFEYITELWDHYIAEDEYDCDGEFDNDTNMCVEYVGMITDNDANAFTIYTENSTEVIIMYQYDAETGSGLLMVVEERRDDGDYEDDASLEEIFAMIDADGDGEVTASEWSDAANNSDEPMGEEDFESLKEMMHMFDDDSSEGLNFAEFEKMMEAMNDDGDHEDDPEMIFRMIDSNGDGEVTASEWSDAGNDSEEPMSDEDYQNLAMMISMYDDDNSEGLNLAEFENMMEAMNGDDGEDIMEDMQTIMVMAMVDLHGDLDDYSVTLAYCDDDMNCEDDVYSVKLSDIAVTEDTFFFSGHSVMFIDTDESGTLNSGDMIMIDTSSLEVDGEWNTPRLHSEEADSYSDENPMPGFTGILATIGLLGAALIRRE